MSGWRLRDENDVEHYSDRPSIGNGDRLERIQADLARDDARNIPWPETTWDDLSWLVAEVERLRAEVETLKAMLLTPMDAMEAMRAAENERLGAEVERLRAEVEKAEADAEHWAYQSRTQGRVGDLAAVDLGVVRAEIEALRRGWLA